ncbi:unnamed protein product [Rhodiola kirilowii]
MPVAYGKESIEIREVWCDNLEAEFDLIREIVDEYPFVAMDTEFPGIILRPVVECKSINEFHFQSVRANVDLLKLIQLGLTFSDADGNLPTCGTDKHCVWQFNFCEFNPETDMFANQSIDLLRESGINFEENVRKGVDAARFGELLMSSGVVLNEDVHWVTFHSPYDFGYLVKLLTCKNLPETQTGFFDLIKVFFPVVYDIKHMMRFCDGLYGGLDKLATLLGVERVGTSHLAGSDSLLTCFTFMKLREIYFRGSIEKYAGILFGIGVEDDQNNS